MKVLLFGATGRVGQGVLGECLSDPDVQRAQPVGRTATGAQHPKLREMVHQDLLHYETIQAQFTDLEACFFCLGVSARRMRDEDYERVTLGITMAAAEVLCPLNPQMTFIHVSGAGTDTSEPESDDVGPRQGKDGKRAASIALRGIPVSSRHHPASPWDPIQDGGLPSVLDARQAPAAATARGIPQSHFDYPADWPSDVVRCAPRLSRTSLGEQRAAAHW